MVKRYAAIWLIFCCIFPAIASGKAGLTQEGMGQCVPSRFSGAQTGTILANAIASTGGSGLPDCSGEKTLLIEPGTWAITSNLTIPKRMLPQVVSGGLFNVANGVTLVLERCPVAGHYQIFTGTGEISLPYGCEANPYWFGGDDSGISDSTTALTKMIRSSSSWEIPVGTWRVASTVEICKQNVKMRGHGWSSAIVPDNSITAIRVGGDGSTTCIAAGDTANPSGVEFHNMKFDHTLGGATSIDLDGASHVHVEGVWFYNCGSSLLGCVHADDTGSGFPGAHVFINNRWQMSTGALAGYYSEGSVPLVVQFQGGGMANAGTARTAGGINVQANGRVVIVEGMDFENLLRPINVNGTGRVYANGNGFEGNVDSGGSGEIVCDRNCTITNNVFNGTAANPAYAIHLSTNEGARIYGNRSFGHASGFVLRQNFGQTFIGPNDTDGDSGSVVVIDGAESRNVALDLDSTPATLDFDDVQVTISSRRLIVNDGIKFHRAGVTVGATDTLDTVESSVSLNCTNGGGCSITMGETAAEDGQTIRICNESTNTATILNSAGVAHLNGGSNQALGQYDCLTLDYFGDRWIQSIPTSNN